MTTIYVKEDTELPDRKPYDLYETERTLIRAALKQFAPTGVNTILDVGAGDGRWGNLAYTFYKMVYGAETTVYGVELRNVAKPKHFAAWASETDYLEWDGPTPGYFDLIVGNPPYGPRIKGRPQAEHFVRHSWDLLAPKGTMMFLLRLNMMAGVDRHDHLWNTHPPVRVGVCSRRPSFYGGGTNATEYGVYVWKKSLSGSQYGRPGKWQVELILHEREAKR